MALTELRTFVLDELNGMIDSLDETVEREDVARVLFELRDTVRNDYAAARQAGTETQTGDADQARHDVEALGVALSIRQLVPAAAGHAVRIVVDGPLYLEPEDAHKLAVALDAAALEAVYADRAVRRG